MLEMSKVEMMELWKLLSIVSMVGSTIEVSFFVAVLTALMSIVRRYSTLSSFGSSVWLLFTS